MSPADRFQATELRLELRNHSDKRMEVRTEASATRLILDLKAPDGERLASWIGIPELGQRPQSVRLAPGERYKIVINRQSYKFCGEDLSTDWTKSGEYSLTARLTTPVRPAPRGARRIGEGFGLVTVTSLPFKISVEAK
jgi:hypothetical protein